MLFIQNFGKCKLISSDKMQISGPLGMEDREGRRKVLQKGTRKL